MYLVPEGWEMRIIQMHAMEDQSALFLINRKKKRSVIPRMYARCYPAIHGRSLGTDLDPWE